MVGERVCFNGEFIVSERGIFTRAHWYRHPKTGRKVILAGTNHMGDRDCYEYIDTILRSAHVVLHEGSGPKLDPEEKEREYKEVKEQAAIDVERIITGDTQIDLSSAQRAFFITIENYFNLPSEKDVFDRSQQHWEQGDIEFFDQLKRDPALEKKILGELQEALAKLDEKDIQPIIKVIQSALKKIKNNTFTRRDFGFTMAEMWANPHVVELVTSALALPRDKITVARTEHIFSTQEHVNIIGIVFGAGHIFNLCYLLESLGYELMRTERLLSMRF